MSKIAYKPVGWLLCLFLLGGFFSNACQRPAPSPPPAAPVTASEMVLALLSEARAWQRRADLHLSDGDINAAIAAGKEVLAIAFPSDVSEAEDIRLDACARLAKLYLRLGGEVYEDQALAQIETGRKFVTHDSFFAAQLETVSADVYEARANRLSDPEAKRAEKRRAILALERAVQIDRRVQRSLLHLRPDGERMPGELR